MYNKRLNTKRIYPFYQSAKQSAGRTILGAYRNYRKGRAQRITRFRSRNLFPYNPVAGMTRGAFRGGRPQLRKRNPTAAMIRQAFAMGRPKLRKYQPSNFRMFNRSIKRPRY